MHFLGSDFCTVKSSLSYDVDRRILTEMRYQSYYDACAQDRKLFSQIAGLALGKLACVAGGFVCAGSKGADKTASYAGYR